MKMKPQNNWMKHSLGVSFHWTSQSASVSGTKFSYAEAVDHFDTEHFIRDLKNAGVGHCIFTLTHAEQYLAYPCRSLDQLLPGRTTGRDLLGEIMDGCFREGIHFIAYYNHSCNGNDDIPWKKACGYDAGISGDLDLFADHICSIVKETALRYGDRLSGWWFDSGYSVDPRGPHNTISCDLGNWQFPWNRLLNAAKVGNENCAVSVNAGVGSCFLYTDEEDFYSGEATSLDEPFVGDPRTDIIDHRWVCIDDPGWVFQGDGSQPLGFSPTRYTDAEILSFVKTNRTLGRMTTFNTEISAEGIPNPASMEQLGRIIRMLGDESLPKAERISYAGPV